ncbi:MAG: HAD family hydrolase [Planctomycetaceae bacterium]
MHELQDIIRRFARPLEPLSTGVEPRLRPLPGIRAVLFDVYGTLVISPAGEIGTATPEARGGAFRESLAAVGLRCHDGRAGVERYVATIESFHAEQRRQGTDHPEVDILEVWSQTLRSLRDDGLCEEQSRGVSPRTAHLERLTVQYESRTNPVWPMPGCRRCLAFAVETGRLVGLVSNAQFFTPLLFPALFGQDLDQLGVDPQLRFFSFESLQAKPGTFLFERAREAVSARGIEPERAIYVGNDLLNDVATAAAVGFRTALFAGDARSLRLREDDERVAGVVPDLVLTDLRQLPGCLPR